MRAEIGLFLALILVGCGGKIGNGNDTSVTDGGTPGTPPSCSVCPTSNLGWAPNGGLGAGVANASFVTDCEKYRHEETRSSSQDSCTYALPTCGSSPVSIGDLEHALSDPDVVAVRSASTKLYGSDPRGCDGIVLAITIGEREIEVGEDDCSRASSCGPATMTCVPVPAGLRALATLLKKLDEQALAGASCQSVFPMR